MRIALIGQAAFGKDVLNALVENNEDVVAALCPPDRDGRPADLVKEAAETHGISLYQYSRMRDSKAIKEFLSLNIDLCVMAFVTDIVPMEMLEAPTYGTIQYHPSLLPEHRGPSSINWPIIEGKSKTGLTIFWPDEGLDTGPILLQKETEIDPDDTLGSVYFGRLYPMGIEAMIEAVNMVKSGNAAKIQQDHSKATYQGWCRAGDAVIDWADTAANIYNMIRGCDPSPGANTILGSDKISFFKASFSQTKSEAIPGTVIGIDDDSFSLAAKDGIISIGRVQLDRDPKLMAGEFVGTGAIQIGKRFGV
ncbi:MAG: methionyl-tRNA formyltransferase [Chloroflexi bacterium]|nr:methionyl-tRNA formyltransferase [Chloroflexota bacterium]HAE34045.1 methionyl-tRNA formyltransferase [Dehalococcoidia bacterium]